MTHISRRNLLSAGAAVGVAAILPAAAAQAATDDGLTALLQYLAARQEYDAARGAKLAHIKKYDLGRLREFREKDRREGEAWVRCRELEAALGWRYKP